MNRLKSSLLALTLGIAGVATAHADVSLNGVRVEAKDVASVSRFYQQVFGLKEVQRIQNPQMFEVMLNFGTNRIGDIVIKSRASDDVKDEVAHIVFNVTDMKGTVEALKAAGGKMEREPFEFGKTGVVIGMAIDPAGNHIELIQQPKK
ncbi:MAG: VOC family protein [Steroidobacteraceae bacterium]